MATRFYAITIVLLTTFITLTADFAGAAEWQITIVDTGDYDGDYNSLALDSSGNPHTEEVSSIVRVLYV